MLTHLHVAGLSAKAPPTRGPRTVPPPQTTVTPGMYKGRSRHEVVREIIWDIEAQHFESLDFLAEESRFGNGTCVRASQAPGMHAISTKTGDNTAHDHHIHTLSSATYGTTDFKNRH